MKEDGMATFPVNPEGERQDIQIYQPDAQVGDMKLYRPPTKVLEEARLAAVALQDVIRNSAIKPVKFGDKEHLLHEHWGILGHFFGYCTKIESTKYVEYPDGEDGIIRGFEATALLLHERTGAIVGRVEAMCLDEEDSWGEVAEYEWRDKPNGRGRERVEVGTKMKPLFQLRSMAETRASAKAYRMKLAWVAVLAGYAATPAEERTPSEKAAPRETREELPLELKRKAPQAEPPVTPKTCGMGHPLQWVERSKSWAHVNPADYDQCQAREQQRAQPQPQTSAPQRPAPRPAAADTVISEPQARRFYAIWKESGKTKAMVIEYLENTFGITDDRKIPANRYKEAVAWAQQGDRF